MCKYDKIIYDCYHKHDRIYKYCEDVKRGPYYRCTEGKSYQAFHIMAVKCPACIYAESFAEAEEASRSQQ